jgi:hypothetical protein
LWHVAIVLLAAGATGALPACEHAGNPSVAVPGGDGVAAIDAFLQDFAREVLAAFLL